MQIAATYPSRERFLTELTLDPPDATSDQAGAPLLDEDYLILSTIHSAKGQEWKSVLRAQHRRRLHSVRPRRPARRAEIEEERRLLYVAMTRAKDHLHLIVPQRFFVHGQRANGDRHVYASRTRFIPSRAARMLRVPRMAGGKAVRAGTAPYRYRSRRARQAQAHVGVDLAVIPGRER